MVGGDVVRQHSQRAHAFQCTLTGQSAFPVRWTADIGAHRTPVVQRADGLLFGTQIKHRNVDLTELLRLHAFFNDGVDFFIRWPDILQADFFTINDRKHILFNIKTNSTGDGVGHDQWWRCQERLLGVRVNTAIEVAVTGQYRRGIQITIDDFLLNHRVQRTGHTVTGSTGESHNTKAQFFQFRQQAGVFQVQLGHFGARREG